MFLHTLYGAFDEFADNESTQIFTGSITLRMQWDRNRIGRRSGCDLGLIIPRKHKYMEQKKNQWKYF